MSIDQPVELKIFVVVTKGIDELFGDLVDKETKGILNWIPEIINILPRYC